MTSLESVHAQMHSVVERVVALQESGGDVEARAEYQKVLPLSQRVVALLEQLEKQVNSTAPESTDPAPDR